MLAPKALCALALALTMRATAEPICTEEDQQAVHRLRNVLQSAHASSFAARAVVQTAVGAQQIVVTRGMPDANGTYSVEIPDHASDCNNLSHRLLMASESHCSVARWYKFQLQHEVIGSEPVTIITALPKDVYRHGYQLVIDERNDIVLRSTTFNGTNALENVELRALSIAVDEVSGTDPQAAQGAVLGSDESVELGDFDWAVSWTPAGFEQAARSANELAQMRTYTDGLSTFSIFVEFPKGEIRIGEGMVNRGATLAYTRGLHIGTQSVLVSVIGEIPINTARMLVESLEWLHHAE